MTTDSPLPADLPSNSGSSPSVPSGPQNLFGNTGLKVAGINITPGNVLGLAGLALLGPKWLRKFDDVTTDQNRKGGPEGIFEKLGDWAHFGVLTAALVGLNSKQARHLMCQAGDFVLGRGVV